MKDLPFTYVGKAMVLGFYNQSRVKKEHTLSLIYTMGKVVEGYPVLYRLNAFSPDMAIPDHIS